MIFVAKQSEPGIKTGIKTIAREINAPEHFIAKIMQDLGKKGLVESTKGPNGGFYLDKASLEISIADIVKALDGDQLFLGCGLGLSECSERRPCPIHFEFKSIREQIYAMLQNAKLLNFYENKSLDLTYLRLK